jgi:PBP1b-binding outer membrane lipoprotein LpoB
MKKLLLILIGFLVLNSCTKPTVENSVENPKEFTTLAIQQLPKDTIAVAFDGNNVYHYNKNNEVILQTEVTREFCSRPIPIGYIIITNIIFFILGLLIGSIKI